MIDDLKKIDASDMLGCVARIPEMLREGALLGESLKLPKFDSILVAGMGGSAMAGEIISAMVPTLRVEICRSYALPEYLGPKTLVIASSYSGNTDECLSCVREARQRKLPVVCVTSGGKLAEQANKEGLPLVNIPGGLQPRAALPYLGMPILKALESVGQLENLKGQIDEAQRILGDLKDTYLKEERSNPARQLAKKLQGKIPIIFGSPGLTRVAGKRLKTQFNENSKATAHLALFPELDHNEIVNLGELKRGQHNFSLILFRDEQDHFKVQKSIEIVKSLIGANLGGVHEVQSTGRSRLTRLFSMILFGDFVSVYLALINRIDPTPVEVIARFKKEISR